jgi:hypothetical protein
MEVKTVLCFNESEMRNELHYDYISETFHCFHHNMGFTAKRKFAEIFSTEEEQNKALQTVQTCHRYNSKNPKGTELTIDEFAFWLKLIKFCEYVNRRFKKEE